MRNATWAAWVPALVVLGLPCAAAHAAEPAPVVRAHATRRTGAISIDGRLDEAAWADAPKHSGFIQRFPKDATPPSVDTRFAIVYDDDAIYVGVWADDPQPDLIRALLTRRDVDAPADAITVAFDSYHDRRTAYAFQLNAAGVQRDMLMFDDSSSDDTWDAVWTGDVARTATGWTAEYRIPLSQLRFASDNPEWGLQVLRVIGRTGEQDSWSPWPRSAPQVVSKFGVVDGIAHVGDRTRLEVLPYATTGIDRMPVDAGDPLNRTNNWRRGVGLDLKYGLGPAFTLSATINPDFGQVEADPSKINLSGSELFFAEKRPFFLEGSDLFKLQIGNSDGSPEGAFYSRRIGAAPATPDESYDFINAPTTTTIYGAAKLTGKTSSGWSVGVLDALTGRETTQIATAADAGGAGGSRQDLASESLTNYAVARIKRDFNDGGTSVGASATAVNRKLDGEPRLLALEHDQAYTGGLQLQHRWADNAWTANVNVMGSWVHGSPDAIAATQEDSVHYFQRPDDRAASFDPTRTSLSGLAVKYMVGMLGDTAHWRFGAGGDLRTPGLELNDAGFQINSDRAVPFFYAQYREDKPTEHLLNWQVNSDVFWVQTFEPRLADYGIETNANVQFANYWSMGAYANLERGKWFVNALRGGPALRGNPTSFANLYANTDTRAPVWFSFNGYGGHNYGSGELDGGIDLGATIQARSNIDLFVGPSIYHRNEPLQYIDEVSDDVMQDQNHFVFGRLHETDLSLTVRANWTFSPHLALQVYAQPYIASGYYSELKEVDHPDALSYGDRFHIFSGNELRLNDGTYHVARGGASYSFDQPDFNFRQLRSTVVLRWEYRPGSTVFAIWSHGRTSDTFSDGRFSFGHDLSELATTPSENIIMVKANYWIGF
ncbi:MAG TPA: DUF5916 domain-containing protein [Kofleriaceae bacterium]|nr:DUF5916 domain-containing protein [Kofleriaceae bacterium]